MTASERRESQVAERAFDRSRAGVAVLCLLVAAAIVLPMALVVHRERPSPILGSMPASPVPYYPDSPLGTYAFYTPPKNLPRGGPGTPIRLQPIPPSVVQPRGSRSWRILYEAPGLSGKPVAISGFLTVPEEPAPRGGFPIVSYAHATTGVAQGCAPSEFSNLDTIYAGRLASAGDVVVATDYEGLGAPGRETYLLGKAAGTDVLDAALAAHDLPFTHTNRKVALLGYSEGGQAALFAAELAPMVAPSLHVAAAAVLAPPTDLQAIIRGARTDPPLLSFYYLLVHAWTSAYPSLPVTDLLTPKGRHLLPLAGQRCETQLEQALAGYSPSQLIPPGFGKDPELSSLLAANSPSPLHRGQAPILVAQGLSDALVDPSSTSAWVKEACSSGGATVVYATFPGAGHGSVVGAAKATVTRWLGRRLAGDPERASCGSPPTR